jgi:hypothetical protein
VLTSLVPVLTDIVSLSKGEVFGGMKEEKREKRGKGRLKNPHVVK